MLEPRAAVKRQLRRIYLLTSSTARCTGIQKLLSSIVPITVSAYLAPSPRPVFIVGSPRSGTSILTWCLGQHSNILVQEESSWIGPLVFQLEIAYRLGTARGERSQLSALGVQRDEFFPAFGQTINALILGRREHLEGGARPTERSSPCRDAANDQPAEPSLAFKIARASSDPKTRWVDGTPEYSFYIHPLRKLFPEARFIHLVRRVSAVVRSMVNFEHTGGPPLVASEEEAYGYWTRTVSACLAAERAYGSDVVCRLRYADLVDQPEVSLHRLLEFLDEPFEAACLEPLGQRINSSMVPPEFSPSASKSDPVLLAEAHQLDKLLMAPPERLGPDPFALAELEHSFAGRAEELSRRPPTRRDA